VEPPIIATDKQNLGISFAVSHITWTHESWEQPSSGLSVHCSSDWNFAPPFARLLRCYPFVCAC